MVVGVAATGLEQMYLIAIMTHTLPAGVTGCQPPHCKGVTMDNHESEVKKRIMAGVYPPTGKTLGSQPIDLNGTAFAVVDGMRQYFSGRSALIPRLGTSGVIYANEYAELWLATSELCAKLNSLTFLLWEFIGSTASVVVPPPDSQGPKKHVA